MQKFQIVKNISFTANTVSNIDIAPGAKPVLSNNYFVYKNSTGGNVVNDNNVRDFLDKEENSELAANFVKYLESNTTVSEFKNIFYDNKKLSSVFNEFYRKKFINKNTELTAISKNLQNTQSLGYKNNNFTSDQHRLNNNQIYLVETGSSEQNYYINIKIDKKINSLPKGDYGDFFKNCIKGNYIDKNYIFKNTVTKHNIYANIPYIKSQQNNISNNFGYAPVLINSFNQSFIGANVMPGDGRDNSDYRFHTFTQFANCFNYTPPKLTGITPGIFINQIGISQPIADQSAKFLLNPIVEFNNKNFIDIPITIKRLIYTGASTFYLVYQKYSNAIINKSFTFDINSESFLPYITFEFTNPSDIVLTKNIQILKDINPEDTLVFIIQDNKSKISDFLIIRCEEFLEFESYSDNSYILTENISRNKLYLNCFVDYNYDDKDMEFYKNDDIIIKPTAQINESEV